jgi:hypothetical protein
MTAVEGWPLVDPRDDGIRPGGRPDECFYCRQRIGTPHGAECVIVTKRIEMRVTVKAVLEGFATQGLWQFDEPHSWGAEMSNSHKNDGTWCAGNFLDISREVVVWGDKPAPWAFLEKEFAWGSCLCEYLVFEFVRVIDATPKRALKVPE